MKIMRLIDPGSPSEVPEQVLQGVSKRPERGPLRRSAKKPLTPERSSDARVQALQVWLFQPDGERPPLKEVLERSFSEVLEDLAKEPFAEGEGVPLGGRSSSRLSMLPVP